MAAMGIREGVPQLSSRTIERIFPGLRGTHYAVTSPRSASYNCIAWAAGDNRRWWWPKHPYYWPPGARYEETVDAFVEAYAATGFAPCDDGELEAGFEKVAIYVDNRGTPTHAARQLGSGMWTSKLGREEDIAHTLEGLSGKKYGRVGVVLKRPRIKDRQPPPSSSGSAPTAD